ncbi:MAG: response regulator transcription factor [Alphaproteobacteria bacterium]|nr:response regulator transcription factor [Alphaproteobacteria bacterium]
MRLLVIEDDAPLADYLAAGLREWGHRVDRATDGAAGLALAVSTEYDVAIVDRMLPTLDGLAVVRAIRAAGRSTPVLILSALAQADDKVAGLRAGGDDYLAKPFAFSELAARIEALARRRTPEQAATAIAVGELRLDLLDRSVTRAGRRIDLQPREFRLLEVLMRNARRVVTRTMLLEQVWDYHFDPQTNVIDVHVSRLRRKIDKEFDRPMLHTVRGSGYVIREPD